MTTSNGSWSTKLRKIGDYERADHPHLSPDDRCVYFGEYTPAGDSGKPAWSLSKANQILANLKKDPSKKNSDEWRYKTLAITEVGELIRQNLKEDILRTTLFVPAPPSKPEAHPEHDARMLQVAKAIGKDIDARPVLETIQARDRASLGDEPRSVDALKANLRIVDAQVRRRQVPERLVILDDMITTGATYVACRDLLIERFGDIRVFGLFVVRRVPLEPD